MNILEFYAAQSPFTDPGRNVQMFEGLPVSVSEIKDVLKGICLDYREIDKYPIQNERLLETNNRYAEEMLQAIYNLDKESPITTGRPENARMMASASQFATLCCSMLRHAGIPARSRIGFAKDGEDYKTYAIIEYHDNGWKTLDPSGEGLEFISAAKVFADCRSDAACESKFKNGKESGMGAVIANLMLDLAAVNKYEMNIWDRYGWMNRPIYDYSDKAWEILAEVAKILANDDKNLEALQAAYEGEEGLHVPQVVFCDSPLVPGHKVTLK
ncbi:MAG: transglutaminase domain-containing protein [Lachnospiraceae bacterium]|jgi:hypothetical protein